MNKSDWDNSGFLEELPATGDTESGRMTEFYVSPEGYTRLFCIRYFGRLRILKTLKEDCCDNPLYQKLLQKEFTIGYRLDHPHICRTLGWEMVEGLGNCILMEYVDGITLREVMERGMLTRELTQKLLTELGEALAYIHSKQIVHRDLKPENILVTHNGNNCKIIDFSLSDCDDTYLLKIPAGTRRYMAPELFHPNATWDVRCDLYSLGVIMKEMVSLTGDKRLLRIAQRCAHPERECRYGSAEEMLAALRQTERHRRPVSRNLLVTAALLCGIIGGWFFLHSFRQDLPSDAFTPLFPANGSIVLPNEYRRILGDERLRPQPDSTHLRRQLKQVLDRRYPLEEQQQSAAYREEMKGWNLPEQAGTSPNDSSSR